FIFKVRKNHRAGRLNRPALCSQEGGRGLSDRRDTHWPRLPSAVESASCPSSKTSGRRSEKQERSRFRNLLSVRRKTRDTRRRRLAISIGHEDMRRRSRTTFVRGED